MWRDTGIRANYPTKEKPMHANIQRIFEELPSGFWGSVEVHFVDGIAKFIKTIRTQPLTSASEGTRQGVSQPHEFRTLPRSK